MAIEYIHKSKHKIVFERERKKKQNKKKTRIWFQMAKFSTSILVSKIHISFIKVSYKSQVYIFQGKHMRKSTCTVNACTSLPAIAPGLSGYKSKTRTSQGIKQQRNKT